MMSRGGPPDDEEDGGGGYRRPPRATRFTKGQSGNPAGRRRGRRREAPYEAVLGQMVTIREGGVERRVTAAEAFLLQLTKRGLEGDGAAARATLAVIEEVTERPSTHQGLPSVIVRTIVVPSKDILFLNCQIFLHKIGACDFIGRSPRDYVSLFQDNAALSHAEHHWHVLLDNDDRHALSPIDLGQGHRDLLNQQRHDSV